MLSTDPFLGEICAVSFDFAPAGWALCDGRLLPIRDNPGLFSLIGKRFGGDGIQTFALPDLRGRAAIGTGRGAGLSDVGLGDKLGADVMGLSLNPLPRQEHDAAFSRDGAPVPACGGGQSVEIRSPGLGLTYIIALQGVYPSKG